MKFTSRYTAYKPDSKGYIQYTNEENQVWQTLFERQMQIIPNRACEEFIKGLEKLNLRADVIPQLPEVSTYLKACSGWEVVPVEALIPARLFFELLANRSFPAATFIRVKEELNYVKEPDIFHELFGHCPMLTDPIYADFVHQYAKVVLSLPEKHWPLLQRLFWFTVEFGLIHTSKGLRAYGGGILSSIQETAYSVESEIPMRVVFNPVTAFRVPYRIDMLQSVYFVINSFQQLYDVVHTNLEKAIEVAHALGEYPPFFPVDKENPNIHIHAC